MDKSLVKGLVILETLARSGRAWGVTELARETGLTKSNTHRLLQTLVAHRFVARDDQQRNYLASLKLWELGTNALSHLDIRDEAGPYLLGLARRTRESVNLAILDGSHVLFVDRIEGGRHVRGGYVGVRAPAHALSTGKALLAWAPPQAVAEACLSPQAFTKATLTKAALIRAELAEVRKQGYAVNIGEWRDLSNSVAVPIWGAKEQPIGAVGVTGPSNRMSVRRLREIVPLLLDVAHAVGRRFGGPSVPPRRP